MSAVHPQLPSQLENFSIFHSFENLIATNDTAIKFLESVNLIPSRTSTPPLCCDLPMHAEDFADKKLKWVWRCSIPRKKGAKTCRKIINPACGTFFEGTACRIEIRDALAIVICFVIEMPVTLTYKHLKSWRHVREGMELSCSTVVDYYSYCREIAEVVASQSDIVLGGSGKTVQVDETFLTKRKYHRGRVTEQMTIIVLGLYCKEDKIGLFFKVNAKSKSELWPYIQKYVHHETSRICTDSAKQYQGVEKMFCKDTVHLQTNHSIGEYVDKSNPLNTINDLENQNKILKKAIKCRRTPKLLHQYMALNFYRRTFLHQYKDDLGSQIMTFLLDIKTVYPGTVDGELKEGLTIRDIDPPSFSSSDEERFLPPSKKPRLEDGLDVQIDDIDQEIDQDDSDPDFNEHDF
ncbi:hypothetical protein TKK_0015738 [Trichogramma kaykai]